MNICLHIHIVYIIHYVLYTLSGGGGVAERRKSIVGCDFLRAYICKVRPAFTRIAEEGACVHQC